MRPRMTCPSAAFGGALVAALVVLPACGSAESAEEETTVAQGCQPAPPNAPAAAPEPDESASGVNSPVGSWSELAPIPTPRIAYAAAALHGCVHVVGGLGRGAAMHEVYDPAADRWYRAADLPVATNHAWAAAAAGSVYVGDGGSKRVFRYEPTAGEWVEVAPSPFRHGDTPATGVIGDRIYVAGGSGDGMAGDEVSMYDPVTDTWTSVRPMGCARHHAAGGVIEGRLHVAGGRPGRQTCHEAYDAADDEWIRLPDLPTGREGMAGAVVGRRFYVIGGEGNPDDDWFLFDAVEVFDPDREEWLEMPGMPNPRHGTFAAVVGDTIFIPGGGRMIQALPINDALVIGSRPDR